jgi:YHS domain-containing protein
MAKDPVCGIGLDNGAPCKSTYAGQIHVFCCTTCKARFDREPGRFAAPAGVPPVGLWPPSAPKVSTFLITSSIGHLLQVVLPKSISNGAQGRRSWLFTRTHSWDGR